MKYALTFFIGACLIQWGLYEIYWPLCPMTIGALLILISIGMYRQQTTKTTEET